MLYPSKNREGLEKREELASLQNRVEDLRLQDKLGKQNHHEIVKNRYEPLTNTIKVIFQEITKTITKFSIKNNPAISDLNQKVLELMKDEGMIAP